MLVFFYIINRRDGSNQTCTLRRSQVLNGNVSSSQDHKGQPQLVESLWHFWWAGNGQYFQGQVAPFYIFWMFSWVSCFGLLGEGGWLGEGGRVIEIVTDASLSWLQLSQALFLGNLLLNGGRSGGRSRRIVVSGNSPVEYLRLDGRWGIARRNFAEILAESEARDARNGTSQAISLALLSQESGLDGQAIRLANGFASGSTNKTASAEARVEVKFQAMVDHVTTVNLLSGLPVQHACTKQTSGTCNEQKAKPRMHQLSNWRRSTNPQVRIVSDMYNVSSIV